MNHAGQLSFYSGPWTEKQLGHLLRRTSFGVTREDYDFFKNKSLAECVDMLLQTPPLPSPPTTPDYHLKNDPIVPDGTTFVFYPENKERDEEWTTFVQVWWVRLMIYQQHNITEKMTLFWHNHFAIEFDVVKDSRYCYHYVNLLREHALGNFKTLLREITTCPAMLVYLNGNLNNKDTPNENYGRELQELFTIGKGPGSRYTEDDVKAAARVLTGWKDDKKKIDSYFDATAHNTQDKLFSDFYYHHDIRGKEGDQAVEETDELIKMICDNPEVAKFICRKIYRWLVDSDINEEVELNIITPLAEIFRQSNYEIKPVLKAILSSQFFYNPDLRGAMFKSPADYFIGIARLLKFQMPNHFEGGFLTLVAMAQAGQQIGKPPNVAGWPAYWESPLFDKKWVISEYLSARHRWMNDFSYYTTFNESKEPYIIIDYLAFVSQFDNAGNAKALVTDSVNLLCCIPPGEKQIAYLQSFIDTDSLNSQPWKELWSAHKKNPADEDVKNQLLNRLRKLYSLIFQLPEYQIM